MTRLLPVADRHWLEEGGFQLVSPLIGAHDVLFAVLALGESRSQLPYSKTGRAVIAAMSAHAAMRLENHCLLELPGAGTGETLAHLYASDLQNEPAVCCPHCSRVASPTTVLCRCGTKTQPAALPLVVNGKFRVERLIGAGGMGVVYLAVDLALDRRVAIKTLPTMTPERARRLRREARAMASVLHPNLAMIFSFEMWRQTPLLMVEYLEGGTLADRLRDGPLPIESAIELGIFLADVLDRLHSSGILHCDIKPSNIGYTRDELPKLLDFGLAGLFDAASDIENPATPPRGADAAADLAAGLGPTTLTSSRHVVGTPLYLSPEAVTGVSPRPSFDLWSLSLVLYEAIAGTLPLAGMNADDVLARIGHVPMPDVREFCPACPPGVAAALKTALAPAESARPETASELRNLLQQVRAGLRSIDMAR